MNNTSNFRLFVEYILVTILVYLFTSLFFWLILGNHTFREILVGPGQILGIIFFYWWPGIIRVNDIIDN